MNYKILSIALIVAIVIIELVWLYRGNKTKEKLLKELNNLLSNEKFDEFDQLIDSKDVMKHFPPYNISYMKLNKAMIQNNPSAINKAFGSFKFKMNDIQKETVYKRGFYYYLGIEDKRRTDYFYNRLKDMNIKDKISLDIMYDTYIEKGYRYLDEVLANISNLSKEAQAPYIAIIADMYRNKGDKKNADEYEKKAEEYINQLKQNMNE